MDVDLVREPSGAVQPTIRAGNPVFNGAMHNCTILAQGDILGNNTTSPHLHHKHHTNPHRSRAGPSRKAGRRKNKQKKRREFYGGKMQVDTPVIAPSPTLAAPSQPLAPSPPQVREEIIPIVNHEVDSVEEMQQLFENGFKCLSNAFRLGNNAQKGPIIMGWKDVKDVEMQDA